jgi:hypothetical protein
MTSSGVKSYNPTLADIITAAYQECGAISIVDTPSSAQLVKGRNKLNLMLSEWMKVGHKVWTWEEGILFLQKGQSRYQLGASSTDNYTDAYDFASTTLSVSAAAGASSITVGSITNIAASDFLGIELDSGSFQWTTVNGAPAGSTVVPAAVLTGAAASGNRVIAYTAKSLRPLKISSGRYFNYDDQTETRAEEIAHIDYMEQPNKTNTASPFTQWRYQPKIPLGVIDVWLTPADVDFAMRFTYQRPIFDFTDNAQTADFPIEWGNALTFGLAAELCTSISVPKERADRIIAIAGAKVAAAIAGDRETASLMFQPDMEDF